MAENKCKSCGSQMAENETVCDNCGLPIDPADLPPEPDDSFMQTAPTGGGIAEIIKGLRSRMKIILIAVGALILLLLLGIFVIKPMLSDDKKPKKPRIAAKKKVTKPVKPAPKPKPVASVPVVKTPSIPNCDKREAPIQVNKNEIDDVMNRWTDAWTKQDFRKYKSFYSRKFKGIKRTIRPATRHYSYEGWMQNRRGMLNYAMWTKLEVKDLQVQCASNKEVKVKFTQYYRSPTYNDVGPKTITFARDGKSLKIVYEEMLQASPL